MDKLRAVQDDLNEATDAMRQNLEQVVGRGEHLELLVDKSDDFSTNARAFQKGSQGLKRALWWKNAKMVAMLVTLVLGLCLLVLFSKCGISLEKCRSGA